MLQYASKGGLSVRGVTKPSIYQGKARDVVDVI